MNWQGTWSVTSTSSLCTNTPWTWEDALFCPHPSSCKFLFSQHGFIASFILLLVTTHHSALSLSVICSYFNSSHTYMHLPVRLSPGIDSFPTGGEECQGSESLPAEDQVPRSRHKMENGTTGVEASACGMNECRQGDLPPLAPIKKWPCSWRLQLKFLLLYILLLEGTKTLTLIVYSHLVIKCGAGRNLKHAF